MVVPRRCFFVVSAYGSALERHSSVMRFFTNLSYKKLCSISFEILKVITKGLVLPIVFSNFAELFVFTEYYYKPYMGLKFISFGSGSSGNCYFLYTDSDGLMIDCGIGIRAMKKYFADYGLSLSQVRNVLITHDHADHVKSVGSLSGEYQVPVWTTADIHKGIYRNWCVGKKIAVALQKQVEKEVPLQIGDFKVTPFAVPHDSVDCVGYEIEHQGIVFTIVTDCGSVTEDIRRRINRANYLVIEANYDTEMLLHGNYPAHLKVRIQGDHGHLANDACGMALVENASEGLRHVWLCHLSEENNHPELARKTVESILRSSGIVAGVDFQMDVLKRKTPTGVYELL